MKQNKSHAVMAQRKEARSSLDNFPTPPWATRALMEYVINCGDGHYKDSSCYEPACGAGHMHKVLCKYFSVVFASDIHDYGYGNVADFLNKNEGKGPVDWIITNPPFRLAEEFVEQALKQATVGVAMLVRTTFLETIGRYEKIYSKNPPTIFAQFSERVPMVKGRLDKKASSATAYAWMVWLKGKEGPTRLQWIPPCRKELERDGDYNERLSSKVN